MKELISLYLLDRASKLVGEKLESIKSNFRSNPKALETLDMTSLEVSLSDTKGKKSFSVKLAEKILKEKLPKTQLLSDFIRIKLIPRGVVTPEMRKYLETNFIVEEMLEITEERVLASTLDKVDIEKCYEYGKPSVKVLLPTKISNDELFKLAKEHDVNVDQLLIEG